MIKNVNKSSAFWQSIQKMLDKKEIICLVLIILLASFFRLWKLDSIPPGIYPDEAINANQALSEPAKIFYPENNGREGLYINLVSLSFKIFNPSIWSFKIISVSAGILTILGIYLLTKELFQYAENSSRHIALFSSLFLATSFWHINFSRIAFRAILVPLLSCFGFYFLFKGFRKKSPIHLIVSGILFGLGLHTYIAFRMIVLVLAVIFVFWLIEYYKNKDLKNFFLLSFYYSTSIILAFFPIMMYFIKNPADFIGRTQGVSIFNQESPILAGIKSFVIHLASFNFIGDGNLRHNISDSPVLFWPVGILFLIGLAFCIKKIISWFKSKDYPSLVTYSFLLSWFLVMLLPGVLTYEGIPHSLRIIGAIPPVFIFAGLGASIIYQFIKKKISFEKKSLNHYLILLSAFLLLFSFIFSQYARYFEIWAKNPETQGAFSKGLVDIGEYLNSLPEQTQKYVVVNMPGVHVKNIPMPAQTPMFIESLKFGKLRAEYILPENIDQVKIKQGNNIIVLMQYEQQLMDKLFKMFPNGESIQDKEIWIFQINN
ncbi:MAG: glycosyltransferase family 39 protein [Candidatus Pacebacteria bacterium]|nr:glycosyltransferase family 39 protein [Candidatus Paceibacterota bacterium]